MKYMIYLMLSVAFCFPVFSQGKMNSISYSAKINLQVINTEEVQKNIAKYLEENQGYFTYRDREKMIVKIKPGLKKGKKLITFLNYLKKLGLVVSENIVSYNYQEKLNSLQVSVTTQTESLSNILKLLGQSGLYQALSIEKKIQGIIDRIEYSKGRIRYLQERLKYAYVHIRFKTYATRVKQNVRSPFGWINRLRLENLF